MIDYATYEAATGRILRVGVTQHLHVQAISAGEAVVAGKAMPTTHHVVGGALVPRPVNPALQSKLLIFANGADECVISNIPAGSSITVDGPISGHVGNIQDGEFIFTTEVPGVYELTLFSFPARNARFEVTAA